MFESKTIRVAFAFASIGVGLILFDTLMGYFLEYKVRYIIELYGLLGSMFTGLAAKNGVDNYISYNREKLSLVSIEGATVKNPPPLPDTQGQGTE